MRRKPPGEVLISRTAYTATVSLKSLFYFAWHGCQNWPCHSRHHAEPFDHDAEILDGLIPGFDRSVQRFVSLFGSFKILVGCFQILLQLENVRGCALVSIMEIFAKLLCSAQLRFELIDCMGRTWPVCLL